jgi:hypothetical protein
MGTWGGDGGVCRDESGVTTYVGASTYLESRDQFSAHYKKAQRRQRTLWDLYIAKNGWGIEMIKTHDLAPLVKGGIPDELRGTDHDTRHDQTRHDTCLRGGRTD